MFNDNVECTMKDDPLDSSCDGGWHISDYIGLTGDSWPNDQTTTLVCKNKDK